MVKNTLSSSSSHPAYSIGTRPAFSAIVLIGVAQILIWGGSFFILAVLARPIMAETGWTRQWVYGALSLGITLSGMLLPSIGKTIARRGGREILACSGFVAAAGLVIMAFATQLWIFIVAWIVLGIAMAMGLFDALYAVLGDCYGREAKSAITTITLISGFCTTLAWPMLALGVSHVGWRTTCLIYAAILLVSIWPIYRLALPASRGGEQRKAGSKIVKLTVDKGVYLLMSTIFMLAAAIMTVMSVQLIDILQDEGISLAAAIGISALLGPSMVAVRAVAVAIKLSSPILSLLVSVLLVLLGVTLIALFPTHAALAVIVYGTGNGLRTIVRGTLPLAILKPEEFAIVMGKIARPSLIAQGLTPLISGLIFEYAGAKGVMFAVVAIAFICVALSLLLKKRIEQVQKDAPAPSPAV